MREPSLVRARKMSGQSVTRPPGPSTRTLVEQAIAMLGVGTLMVMVMVMATVKLV